MEVHVIETALIFKDRAERMDGAGVRAVLGNGGLDDEACANEVERGENEAGDEV